MKKALRWRVYSRTRLSHGRKVKDHRGYYTLEQNGPRVWRGLPTPDRAIAEKWMRDIAEEALQEKEGLVPSKIAREASSKPLLELIETYQKYLETDCKAKHVNGT